MGTSRRYAEHYDQLMRERLEDAGIPPCTLPKEAYGEAPLEWVGRGKAKPPVWAWISWPHRPAERVAAFAAGWNDRVVIVSWNGERGELSTVVWRNAVTRRTR